MAESVEAFLDYLLPGRDWMPAEARAGLMHIADGIQSLRWLRAAHTAPPKGKSKK